MDTFGLVETLRKKRSTLLKAYVFHVVWFSLVCVSAATGVAQLALLTLIILTLITMAPVLIYTVSVHKACRAIDPSARSVGLVPVILFSLFLTPLESGLILPFKNLWVSRCILDNYQALGLKPASVK